MKKIKKTYITEENYESYQKLRAIKKGIIPYKYVELGIMLFLLDFMISLVSAVMIETLSLNFVLALIVGMCGGISMGFLAFKLPGILATRDLKKIYPEINTKVKKEDLEYQLEQVEKKKKRDELEQKLQESQNYLEFLKSKENMPGALVENDKSLEEINKKLEKIEQKRKQLIEAKTYLETIKNEEEKCRELENKCDSLENLYGTKNIEITKKLLRK